MNISRKIRKHAETRRMPQNTSLNARELDVIDEAARKRHQTRAEFIRDAAVAEACRETGRSLEAA